MATVTIVPSGMARKRNFALHTLGIVGLCWLCRLSSLQPDARAGEWLELVPPNARPDAPRVVLIAGDEEYRSEEALPALGRILATRHGFRCTVHFATDPQGVVDPTVRDRIPGLHRLAQADAVLLAIRFRSLPDADMEAIDRYLAAGKPILGLRTSTHAFQFPKGHRFHRFSFDSQIEGFEGGFGRQVLGETWVAHHGDHGTQSTRGRTIAAEKGHPILLGIPDSAVWGPTDVYSVRLPLAARYRPLLLGEVLEGISRDSKAVDGPQNRPMMPIAWVGEYRWDGGSPGRVFTTTMGAAEDFACDAFRRLIVNALYWSLGLEAEISEQASVEWVGAFKPTPFGFDGHQRGRRVEEW